MRKHIGTWLALLSMLSALFFNSLNIKELETSYPEKLRNHSTVITSDDESYLSPANHFYQTGTWKTAGNTTQDYVFRTPGYGLFYLLCKILAGENALHLLAYAQVLLFALGVWLLFKTLAYLTNVKIAAFLSVLYGILPLTSGFLYYTLTEGLSPFFVIAFFYLLVEYRKKHSTKHGVLAALTLAVLILIRPIFVYFVLIFLFDFALPQKQKKGRWFPLVLVLISLMPILVWQIRNFTLTGKLIPVHPVYLSDNTNAFRAPHKAMGDFYKCFTVDGAVFHDAVEKLWATKNEDSLNTQITRCLANIPAWVKNEIGETNLRHTFMRYNHCMQLLQNNVRQQLKKPFPLVQEKLVCTDFDFYTKTLREKHLVYCFLGIPLLSLKKSVVHSNLSLHIFQHTWRGSLGMEVLRYIGLIIHVLLFCAPLVLLFFHKTKFEWTILLLPAFYMGYISFFQVMNEERYTLPILPILFLGWAIILKKISAPSFAKKK